MGGGTSVLLVARRPHVTKELSGLITQGAWLTAELFDVKNDKYIYFPEWLNYIIYVLAFLFPRFAVMGRPEEQLKFARFLCDDKKVQDEFMQDPEVYRDGAQLGWLVAITKELKTIDKDYANIHLPVLAMHGNKDCITHHTASIDMINKIPSKDKHLKIYDGLRHQLISEPNGGEKVVADMIQFVLQRSKPAVTPSAL